MELTFGCLSPQTIRDVTHRFNQISVPCGKCDYCRNIRRMDLTNRVHREILRNNVIGGTMLFITLTYDNGNLPVYRLSRDGYWYSNRSHVKKLKIKYRGTEFQKRVTEQKYSPIDASGVDEFYHPVEYHYSNTFGHLCSEDAINALSVLRTNLRYFTSDSFRLRRKKSIELYDIDVSTGKKVRLDDRRIYTHPKDGLFDGLTYEQLKFRYFLCGEYGPTTFRPHYHAILFFDIKLNDEQQAFVQKNLSEVWKFGDIGVRYVYDDGVKNYLSEYVTGFNGLPKVLTAKSLRPFCTFSKAPVIGTFDFDKDKIQEQLNTGVVEFSEFNPHTSEFRSSTYPQAYFHKFFPKCKQFSYGYPSEKLRAYSYVYRLFKELGIKHTEEEVLNLRVKDIPWELFDHLTVSVLIDDLPSSLRLSILRCIPDIKYYDIGYVGLATYADRYASLVCYRYCVLYNMLPYQVMECIERIYQNQKINTLSKFYTSQCEASDLELSHFILHDRDFIRSLPDDATYLEDWQRYALESYGIPCDVIYSNGILDSAFRDYYDLEKNTDYRAHCDKYKQLSKDGVKGKKLNEYKRKKLTSQRYVLVQFNNQSYYKLCQQSMD